MLDRICIDRYKCFKQLRIEKVKRVNLVVGENGAGKTAFMEAVFMALGCSTEIPIRMRNLRGLSRSISGTKPDIEESVFSGLFYGKDWSNPIKVALLGNGPEARSLTIERSRETQRQISFNESEGIQLEGTGPIKFSWTDHKGNSYDARINVTPSGFATEITPETLPNYHFHSAHGFVEAKDIAQKFSALSISGRQADLLEVVRDEYPWIQDLSVEVDAGSPALFVKPVGLAEKVPLAAVSGGINRIVDVMLSVASRQNGLVLVDEVENGLYYRHQSALWRGLWKLAERHNTQLILSTHSEEWLKALVDAAPDASDIALWRFQRGENEPVVHQFAGNAVIGAIVAGEVR